MDVIFRKYTILFRIIKKLQPDGCQTLSNIILNINMFSPLLLIRYHLVFAVHVDLNSKKVIDSHIILKE